MAAGVCTDLPYLRFEEDMGYRWINPESDRFTQQVAKGWRQCQFRGQPVKDNELILYCKPKSTKETT